MPDNHAPTTPSLHDLRALTPARIGLGRSGASLPTRSLLHFTLDHARARDAVHADFDALLLVEAMAGLGREAFAVASRVQTRGDYLRRPDLGRLLDESSRQLLDRRGPASCDVAFVIADGLSPAAVQDESANLVACLLPHFADLTVGPVIVASGARVALGDAIGGMIGARLMILLIGERPGLSTPRSMGAYLTFGPRPGLTDADRNCVSNIHAHGLSNTQAATRIAWLARAALDRSVSGVSLKDDSGVAALPLT